MLSFPEGERGSDGGVVVQHAILDIRRWGVMGVDGWAPVVMHAGGNSRAQNLTVRHAWGLLKHFSTACLRFEVFSGICRHVKMLSISSVKIV